MSEASLKARTARTLKWNVIDRLSSQVLYAVTGVVLANLLSPDDYGLVGAVMIFQAFASLFIDSGFSYALIQRKQPTETDYSTVLWFNMGLSAVLYMVLYFCAPLIADVFQHDERLVPLSRVMFLSFILNASAIVQTNRLMKRMDVRMVAVSNTIGLLVAAVVGIWLALAGYGAWAIVWQTLSLAAVKSAVLWLTQRWLPRMTFSWGVLRSYFGIGSRMMLTSFLNTLFLNIYGFFIGHRVGMTQLGYYHQGDKWSKMGIMSISQVLTSSFLPALSSVQDDNERFMRACSKMNRFTAYLLFPALIGLMAVATSLFHTLFGYKWDESVPLFRLLLLRGVFTVITGLYSNFLLAKAHARTIMWMEVLRDSVALVALLITLPWISVEQPGHPVLGLELLLWGQVAAAAIAWFATLIYTVRLIGTDVWCFIRDLLPYLALTLVGVAFAALAPALSDSAAVVLVIQLILGAVIYIGGNRMAGSKIQNDVFSYFMHKNKKADLK